MAIIKRFCSKCEKELIGLEGYYFQIFERDNKVNRETAFLCDNCCQKMTEFMEN